MSLTSLKRPFGLALLALFALALALPALAQQQPTPQQGARIYAVMPFQVNSDKYRYMGPGAQSMMSSRLAWVGYFEPAPQANAARAGGRIPTTLSDAQSIMGQIGAEYLVTGNLDFQDKQVNAEVKVWSRTGQTWSKNASVPVEGLVPALERLAGDVRTEVFKRPGDDARTAAKKDARKEQQQGKTVVPKNAEFIVGDTGEAPVGPSGGPVMNPQFRYEGGTETPGRWQSQSMRFAATSMAVGDFVGDKKNRVIFASPTTIYAYEFYQNTLKPLAEMKLSVRMKTLRVSLLDIDHDGRDEILVSVIDDPQGNAEPKTLIYKYAGGKFEEMMKPIKMYTAVVRLPPSYKPTLVGQRKGFHKSFDESGVSEMAYQNGSLEPLRKLHLPSIANVFNFAYLPDGNTYKLVILNEYSYPKVFTQDLESQYSGEEGYNSSAVYIFEEDRLPGMDMGRRESGTEVFYYIPIRMIPASFGGGGKYELMMNKDISVAAQVFQKFRRFSQGEIHSVFWDGVGLSLAWKTRRIKGSVVDIGYEDLKNTGGKQLLVCMNTYSGAMSASDEKTIVIAYDMDTTAK
jgi:hypothetical protein